MNSEGMSIGDRKKCPHPLISEYLNYHMALAYYAGAFLIPRSHPYEKMSPEYDVFPESVFAMQDEGTEDPVALYY